ncbi:MAG: YdcF family protein [Oscillospiraceae bacterium]|nr:YdcF family protein [Oscillospiraceae bacterium]
MNLKINIRRLISGLLILPLSGLLCAVFIFPMTVGIVNFGNVSGVAFCVAVMLIWAFFPLIRRRKILFTAFKILVILASVGLLYVGFLSMNMFIAARDEPEIPPEKERTLIVLGCQIRGDNPSFMLARRLAAARNYLLADENSVCVVTGGIGQGQARSEACVMRDWLINNGISEERIFLEERSTSTAENIAFASEIIDEFNLPRDVVIVSDGFHLWRGKIIAERFFDEVNSVPAKTQPYVLPTYAVREWLALTRELVFSSN